MMKKVLIPTKLHPVAKELLEANGGYTVVQDESTDLATLAAQNADTYALFVRSEKVTAEIIDADGNFSGNEGKGMALYLNGLGSKSGCAACHGEMGLDLPPGSLEFDAYPGLLSKENPWEFQHKIRFGQPGSEMPGAVSSGGSLQDVVDLSAFAQTLPEKL